MGKLVCVPKRPLLLRDWMRAWEEPARDPAPRTGASFRNDGLAAQIRKYNIFPANNKLFGLQGGWGPGIQYKLRCMLHS